MATTPPNDPASPARAESDDARQAAAAREEAIRALLEAPDVLPPPVAGPRLVPISLADGAGAFSSGPGLPVIPSAARLASAPLTLLEVALACLVAGLALVLAFIGWSEARSRARVARTATELRELAAAFEQHHRTTGAWPAAAAAPGAVPAGMENLPTAEVWRRPTPLGGHYAWVNRSGKNRPALGIAAFVPDPPLNVSREELTRIDTLLDDGDLASGRFQTGFNGWPVYSPTGAN